MEEKKFDLNIEKILEDWEVYHGIREVIANAIDEQLLTATEEIEILKDEKSLWHIRDFGRGLNYEHLTQKENDEKLGNPNVIGKFGIGLKDAFGTFDRKGIIVYIKSRHGDITIQKSEKHDFEDVITLHACIHPPSDPNLVGTDFILGKCTDKDIEKAKDLFFRFSEEKVLETTKFGMVLEKKGKARIYINGVRAAEEENFLFSYNITSLTKNIRKALNRERTNVSRNAYSERIKSILLSCKNEKTARALVEDLKSFQDGTTHDELQWADVSTYACKLLNASGKVVFVTPNELQQAGDIVNHARGDGYEIILIPEKTKEKIRGLYDDSGNKIRDIEQFSKEWNESFEFKFIREDDMSSEEKNIFRMTDAILSLVGGRPSCVKEILISETMRLDSDSNIETTGLWEEGTGRVVIKRSQLRNLRNYAGTLLHEIAHAKSEAPDYSRQFEQQLCSFIGTIVSNMLMISS